MGTVSLFVSCKMKSAAGQSNSRADRSLRIVVPQGLARHFQQALEIHHYRRAVASLVLIANQIGKRLPGIRVAFTQKPKWCVNTIGGRFSRFATASVFGCGTVSGPTVAQNWARGELDYLCDLPNLSMVRRK